MEVAIAGITTSPQLRESPATANCHDCCAWTESVAARKSISAFMLESYIHNLFRPEPYHARMRPRRILIVEDDPKTSASIEMYLRHEGYRTDIARTGDEGLARARQQPPDLVILDLMLPGRNGLEVCAALRAESRLPVIMLTARSTED